MKIISLIYLSNFQVSVTQCYFTSFDSDFKISLLNHGQSRILFVFRYVLWLLALLASDQLIVLFEFKQSQVQSS